MPASASRAILIVDDEPSLRHSLRLALAAEGRTIDAAASAEEALVLQAEGRYDVIISDLMMPGLSGLDFLRALKEQGSPARLILITGYPTLAAAESAVAMGAFGFLPKPFLPAEIRALVARALEAEAGESGPRG